MEPYFFSLKIAICIFPFIAFILTIPFLIFQYQKYGAIPTLKSIIFYSMILYLIVAYFMVILPLPSISFVRELKGPFMQLHPFNFINDFDKNSIIHITNLKTLLLFLNKPAVYIVLFNFLLTMPFGFYLRYYFQKKWYQSLFYSFLLSLFFELTQLSGLYGIYPRPYRIFDVDDLIINTLGGLSGHILAPILMFFLPTRAQLEKKSYEKGKKVRIIRRIMAFFIDALTILSLSFISTIMLYNSKYEKLNFLIAITFYYVLIPILTNGITLGKKIVSLKLSGIKKDITWYKILLRNILFTYFMFYPFIWIEILDSSLTIPHKNIIMLIIKISILSFQIINIIYYIKSSLKKENLFLYEKITDTKNISTIVVEEKSIDINTKKNKKKSTKKKDNLNEKSKIKEETKE